MRRLACGLLGMLLSCAGCSSQPEQLNLPKETTSVHVEPVEATFSKGSPFASDLELDILISLWLHLDKQRSRLQQMLNDSSLAENDKLVVNRFLVDIETQQRLTWQAAFNE